MNIDLTVPSSWTELTQSQLLYLFSTIVSVERVENNRQFLSKDDYSNQVFTSVATYCFCRWTGIEVVSPYGESGFLMRYGKTEFPISAEEVASVLTSLSWIRLVPEHPVRLESIDGAPAVSADLSGFPFESYLTCENLWQGYNATNDPDLLRQMAEILYQKTGISLTDPESLSIFYWWASVKDMFASLFPNFFRASGLNSESSDSPAPDYNTLRRNVDAQIRALTKGDVTKEPQILALDTWRALTELDAQAREYEELNKKFKK